MMRTIETIQSEYGMDQASALAAAGISASSYKRWKHRIRSGLDPVQKPGAKKVAPIDLTKLQLQIEQLEHGKSERQASVGSIRPTRISYRAGS